MRSDTVGTGGDRRPRHVPTVADVDGTACVDHHRAYDIAFDFVDDHGATHHHARHVDIDDELHHRTLHDTSDNCRACHHDDDARGDARRLPRGA